MRWLREHWADALGLVTAVTLGLPSLGWAYGRDQGLFHTVAREWMHGRWPYVDVFELKPPGIYVVYALGLPFGGALWPIRVFDLMAVVGTGALAGVIASRKPGSIAVGALAAVGLYYSLFDYWHSAQVESWQCLFTLAAIACALELEQERRAAVLAGVCVAAAALFKPTALLAGVVALGCLMHRHPRRRAALTFGASLTATLVLVMLPFAMAGGLGDLAFYLQLYGGAAAFDVRGGLARFFFGHAALATALGVAALALGAAVHRSEPRWRLRAIVTLSLFMLSLLGVVVQGRFVLYHFGALLAPAALAFTLALQTDGRLFRRSAAVAGAGAVIASTLLGFAPAWVSNAAVTYPRYVLEAPGDAAFVGEASYDFAVIARTARALQALGPDPAFDRLHVRGYEAPLYVLSGLSSPARVLNETHLSVGASATLTAWRAEQERRLREDPPRFFVTFGDRPEDVAELRERGYVERYRDGRLILLERPASRITPVIAQVLRW